VRGRLGWLPTPRRGRQASFREPGAFRWSFYGVADVDVAISVAAICGFLALCPVAVWWIFRIGWKLKA
jgi:hypothetical protein